MNLKNPANRRAILWNVQQPGDAYDIRKSMIAKLPQHPARFMGQNLELVCLFQAAQIERLAQFLDEMTLQMRSIQRIELDRHLYEVQIKQLAEKLQVSNEYKIQNQKLRQFIKSQSEEMQNLQKYRNSAQNLVELQNKYESLLNELKISRENYAALQRNNNESLKQIAEYRFKNERTEKSLSQERQTKQREIKISVQKAIFETKSAYQSREYQLKGQINVIKQNLLLKNKEIQLQKSKNIQLSKILAEKQELIRKYTKSELQFQTNKTQEFLKISRRLEESTYFLEQKEKNIINLKDEITYLNKKIKQFEEQLKRKQEEIRKKEDQIRNKTQQLKIKETSYNNNPELIIKISQGEQRITILSSELQRLKELLSSKEKESADRDRQLIFYKQKSVSYERTLEYLQKEIKEKESTINKLLFDIQNFEEKDIKIQKLGSQVQRLNIVLREKLNEISKMQIRINELTQIQIRFHQLYNSNQYNLTILKAKQDVIRVLEQRIKEYDMKLTSFEESNKLNFDEINRLNLKITTIQNINIQIRKQADMKAQASFQSAKLSNQVLILNEQIESRKIENTKLRQDNQMMFREIQQLEQKLDVAEKNIKQQKMTINLKIQQKEQQLRSLQNTFSMKEQSYIQKLQMYSKSMPKMSAQIQRLHQLLQKRQTEIKRLQEDLNLQIERNHTIQRKTSTETQMRFMEYQRNISYLQRECQNYERLNNQMSNEKNRIGEKVQLLETMLRDCQSELQRIRTVLKVKQSTFQEHEQNSITLQNGINQLRDENLRLQNQYLKVRQELQTKNQLINKNQYEIEVIKRQLSKTKEDYFSSIEDYRRLKSQFQQTQNNPSLLQKIQNLNQQIIKNENQRQYLLHQLSQKKRRLQVYEEEIKKLQLKNNEFQEIIKHSELANIKRTEEIKQRMSHDFQIQFRNETFKYNQLEENYRKLQYDYQNSCQNSQNQTNRLETLMNQNSQLRSHLSEYQQKLFSYEQKIALFSQQIQRLSLNNEELRNQIQKTKREQVDSRAIKQLNTQLEQTKIELTNLKNIIQQYESINQHAIAERDELFSITHEQQETINGLKSQINSLSINLQQSQNAKSQLKMMRQQYNIIFTQLSTIKQQYTQVINELQIVNKEKQINPQELVHRDNKIHQLELSITRITEQYENSLRLQRERNFQLSQNHQNKLRILSIVQAQNRQLKNKMIETQKIKTQQQEMQVEVEELKTAYINVKLENQEINRILQEMHDQLFQATQYKNSLYQQNISLTNQNTRAQARLEQEKHTLIKLNEKLTILSSQIEQTRVSAENKIRNLEAETNAVKQQNYLLRQQIENLQVEISQVSVYQEISSEWQIKYNNLYQAYEETYKIYNQIKVEYQNVQENLRLTELKIPKLQSEFQKLNSIIIELKNQILTLKQQNQKLRKESIAGQHDYKQIASNYEELQKQLKRVYNLNNDLNHQVSQIRLRLTDQHTLEEKIRQNMILLVILFAEIQSLRNRVHQTQKQCEQVRRSSITPIKAKK